MVRVTLTAAPGTSGPSVTIDAGGSSTLNTSEIEGHLKGIELEEERVIVLDANLVGVDFREPTGKKNALGVSAAKYYSVVKVQETEADSLLRWKVDAEDDVGQELELKIMEESERTQRAMMGVYIRGFHSVGEDLQFPDHNENIRAAYSAGISAQVPAEYANSPSGEIEAFKVGLLRQAFTHGVSNALESKAMPSVDELREAYKKGKEAVYLAIPDQSQWASVNKDTFKLCSVPVEYAQYLGGVSQKLKDESFERGLLRQVFHQGVDDAWAARSDVQVSDRTAVDRIPDAPSVQDAFLNGVAASKLADTHGKAAPQIKDGETFSVSIDEVEGDAASFMFAEGLRVQAANTFEGLPVPSADLRVPSTSTEIRDKCKIAYVNRLVRAKETDRVAKEREREDAMEAAKLAEEENTFLVQLQTCCYDSCCPMFTWKEGDILRCYDTPCSDWLLILFLFGIYYVYLGLWFWAFIEILMTVAEPARPH